jgi:hypothetical protein
MFAKEEQREHRAAFLVAERIVTASVLEMKQATHYYAASLAHTLLLMASNLT